ncbi:hypothetical protein [Natronolimnobius baerhuensis]|uniref:Uncharacterized protein n=1 Tax=Natronolimnobius baerhuensis TaxID=253108 RepID=A0A202E9H6_9EURY|nr:hypothetical protein [Natronolimnobius baerhuensis]OVE84874.1 hypothetical protein B2G88_10915 [Natronolimnobius baerhuensis]
MHLGSTLTGVGFWLGTLLPVAYLPVFISGIDSLTRLGLLFGLVTVNVLALAVGQDYSPDCDRTQNRV